MSMVHLSMAFSSSIILFISPIGSACSRICLYTSQFACLKLCLSLIGINIGWLSIVNPIGMWSEVVGGPGFACVLW